jgi:hypothetical protein
VKVFRNSVAYNAAWIIGIFAIVVALAAPAKGSVSVNWSNQDSAIGYSTSHYPGYYTLDASMSTNLMGLTDVGFYYMPFIENDTAIRVGMSFHGDGKLLPQDTARMSLSLNVNDSRQSSGWESLGFYDNGDIGKGEATADGSTPTLTGNHQYVAYGNGSLNFMDTNITSISSQAFFDPSSLYTNWLGKTYKIMNFDPYWTIQMSDPGSAKEMFSAIKAIAVPVESLTPEPAMLGIASIMTIGLMRRRRA